MTDAYDLAVSRVWQSAYFIVTDRAEEARAHCKTDTEWSLAQKMATWARAARAEKEQKRAHSSGAFTNFITSMERAREIIKRK